MLGNHMNHVADLNSLTEPGNADGKRAALLNLLASSAAPV